MEKAIKWLSNFWYHYKFRTIFFTFIAVLVAVCIYEGATREDYDMKVYLYMSEFVSSDVERALENTIEETFLENGEEKNVQVINLSYDAYSADSESKMSYAAALAGELRMKEDFLYITDRYRFEELDENEIFENVFEQNDMFDKSDNKAGSVKGSDFEQKFIKNLKENNVTVDEMPELFVSLLTPPEKDDKDYEKYKTAKTLAELIINKDKK